MMSVTLSGKKRALTYSLYMAEAFLFLVSLLTCSFVSAIRDKV